jgi:hypothetical protein
MLITKELPLLDYENKQGLRPTIAMQALAVNDNMILTTKELPLLGYKNKQGLRPTTAMQEFVINKDLV